MTRGVQVVRPDNFTPPSRTPWGGRRIVRNLKGSVALDIDADAPVGESWEVSVEPSFPTMLESGVRLIEAVEADPVWWLGQEVAAQYGGCPLLLKVVDTAADLSVQVHPSEDDTGLAAGESGKTEAWIVLAADVGARLLLGFRDGVGAAQVAQCVRGGGRLDELMNSVIAVTGDVFFIPPGLAHALGGGLLVLEPQRVRPGRRSVTHRFWDWGRRYDSDGHLSATGAPRALHLDQALTITDWTIGGADCVARWRRTPVALSIAGGLRRWCVLDEPAIYIERWVGTGEAALPDVRTLLGVFCAAGQAQIRGRGQQVAIGQGRTAVVPAGATHLIAELSSAEIYFCVARV